ncbi:LysR family transcriptional regulator [Actinomadura rupiterrae]|uniref:LysR family transcriptional regulator n=1 Tax=Actinomadura rupiterrae TaxID=559627 RepID=UPI0020A30CF4|nr:LysR family transcriptional regulator [Actinomadura rupiterrae]MCP2336164.1 DNA-binding transcriptional LysR family regulator [Actinomadura rupiterrae]
MSHASRSRTGPPGGCGGRRVWQDFARTNGAERSGGGAMELAELEAFFALSEELHFGHAAERLHLSQSRISQLIRALERDLGAPLFARTSRRVELTPLGRQALTILRPPYEALHAGYAEARAVAQGVVGRLSVGFLGGVNGPAFAGLIAAFAERHPSCELSTLEVPITDFYGALRRGETDLTLTLLPVDEPDLKVGDPITSFGRVVVLPTGHPLTAALTVDIEALAGNVLLSGPPELPEVFRRSYFPAATPKGRPLASRDGGRTYQETFNLVATGQGLTITHAGIAEHYRHPGVEFRPLRGLPPAYAALAWRASADKPQITSFAALARARAVGVGLT